MAFLILLQVHKVNLLNRQQILITQVKASKFATYSKNSLYVHAPMTKTIVFTSQEQDVTAKKASGNVTTHAQHRIIYICIIYANYVSTSPMVQD